MARRMSAADYLEKHSLGVSIILAELAESAGAVSRSWNLAVASARSNPDQALTHLVEAEIRLDNHVRLELADTLRPIRAASARLDRELPDDDATTLPPDDSAHS